MPSANDTRKVFLDYFARHGHEVVPSSPLVPHNDPTLLFVNAGMVQFKNVFTGLEHRPYQRAVTSQKCVRAGGKHNDLDNVGYTARHHTFFEMLGNFSFGDYFKELAIELAWKLVTEAYGLPPERLLATVYAEDDEAFELWKRIAGLPEARIIRIPTSDNFWAMGDTGPCGPCSEIFYDHGPDVPGGPPGSPDEDGDRFIEIWNLVFMQFEQFEDRREPLPRPSIDTGMGLERIAAVLQGRHDNYDIDLFRRIIQASEELTGTYATGEKRPSHKVIADHLRACAFLIADGVMPSNEGRGYVLRRIMRRAMRHAHMLGAKEPLMWRLVPVLVAEMGQAYPELSRAEPLVTEILKLEEARFRDTLERGLRLLDEATAGLSEGGVLPGEVAFRLYDTYGFPLDLTQDALRARGMSVDLAGFEQAMERQRAEARKSWKGSGEQAEERVWFELRETLGATEFLGYDTDAAEAHVKAIVAAGKPVEHAEPGHEVMVVTNQTPFYGEAGGQIGDTGTIRRGPAVVTVTDTKRKADGDLIVHIGRLEGGALAVGDTVELAIDAERRARIRRAHSATHLLHAALRRHLGDHVTQKGSLVAPDRLRFDFAHPKAVSADELAAIETEVNHFLRQNDEAAVRLMAREEAIEAGAMALFGEKYGDEVRVVSMGREPDGRTTSIELCGGTHVRRTGDIALFKIVHETAVAAGIRRIEVLTGEAALEHVNAEERMLGEIAGTLRVTPQELPDRVAGLINERRRLEQEISRLRQQLATGGGDAHPEVKDVAGIRFAGRRVEDVPAKDLRGMADTIRKQMGSGVAAVVSVVEGKAALVVSVSDDLKDALNAVDLVRAGVAELGGKGGGGRPDFAQGGGPEGARAEAALAAIERTLEGARAAAE